MRWLCLAFCCLAWWAASVRADVVTDWNTVLNTAVMRDDNQSNPTFGSRAGAMVHAAVYDAVNAITRERQPYALRNYQAPAGASIQAAAAQAAYQTLVYLFPEQQAYFKAELARQLSQVPEARARTLGIQVGTAAAEAIIRLRKNDGAYVTVPYRPGYCPGDWRPTPPDYTPAAWPQWPYVRPFVLRYGAQFRPGPPPPLNSSAYATAFNEVKRLGEIDSRFRTPDQTRIADFWSYDLPPAEPPPAEYNQILQVIAKKQRNTVVQNAYLFALVNLGLADGVISCWDTKYKYNVWRPVTGIRLAGQDWNSLTAPDPCWFPLGPPDFRTWTPPFPAYTSGHATMGGVLFRALQLYYRTDQIAFTFESDDLPGRPRSYKTLSQADQENADSRVYMGVHWRFDQTVGQQQGHKVAEYIYNNAMQPIRR